MIRLAPSAAALATLFALGGKRGGQQWWQRHGRRIAVFADTDFVAGARIAGYTGYTGCARIRAA